MARCDACTQEMLTADQCAANQTIEFPDGQRLSTIPFGSEQDLPFNDEECQHVRCGDCGVRPGGAHHPGCDMEECPRCHGQRISCECFAEGDVGDVSMMEHVVTQRPRNGKRLLARVAEDGSDRVEIGRVRGEQFERLYVLKRLRAFDLLFSLHESLDVTMSASISSWVGDRRYQAVCLNRVEVVYSDAASIGTAEEYLLHLLSNVRHLCDAQNLDFGAIDRKAYARYLEERRALSEQAGSR